ncbi:MAG: hypothetical protein KAU10_06940, partial [Dehalococcoidia bacterium]|nr:hypothetical protein [Dehalococcoidia bacterium]
NPQTNLVPNRTPETDEGRDTQRFDFLCSDTSVPGLWATRLLMAWRMTGCEELRNMACAELEAWARYGWDISTQQPWGLLELDGRAVPGPRAESGTYDKYAPCGHLNLWTDYVNDYEHPGPYTLSYLAAYHATGDPEFLTVAEQFAACYAKALPANGGHGTYAHRYGQLISLAVGLAALKKESKYLALARQVADEAIDKLWCDSLFAGYPNHGYYEAIHGVGYLLLGLVELSQAEKGTELSWQNNPFAWNL